MMMTNKTMMARRGRDDHSHSCLKTCLNFNEREEDLKKSDGNSFELLIEICVS